MACNPAVVNAIESHHHEVDQLSIEAVIAEAADAISGARPGARREDLEAYIKRIRTLEELSQSFEGVAQAFAIQAGREVPRHRQAREHRRPGLRPPGSRHRQEDRREHAVSRSDQGDGHP